MTSRRAFSSAVPSDCWYALSSSGDVGRDLLSVRTAGGPVVLYRTEGGRAIALEDRCAHRPYPLSAGSLVGDDVRCGLCGFVYDAGGQCVSVPSQSRVPFGAAVAAYPVDERDGVVWVWLGEPGRARLHRAGHGRCTAAVSVSQPRVRRAGRPVSNSPSGNWATTVATSGPLPAETISTTVSPDCQAACHGAVDST